MRRKLRKAEGEDIFRLISKSAPSKDVKDPGLRCRSCGKLKRWKEIDATYEMRGADLWRVWWCPKCGDMLREDNLSDLAMVVEQERSERDQQLAPASTRLLVCGDREWIDVRAIAKTLKTFDAHTTTLIHGNARGADRIAGDLGKKLGMQVIPCPAQWRRHDWLGESPLKCSRRVCKDQDEICRLAGPRRNREMMQLAPQLVIAFHDDLDRSKGTKDMVKLAKANGVKVRLVRHAANVQAPSE